MLIQEAIESDWKTAMKARSPTKDTLSLIRTEMKNKLISLREQRPSSVQLVARLPQDTTNMQAVEGKSFATELADNHATTVLSKMAKQRRDSIAEYSKAGRNDLLNKESDELNIIESYLPKQMSDEDLVNTISATIAELGGKEAAHFPLLMKAMGPKVKGLVDGKRLQDAVKQVIG